MSTPQLFIICLAVFCSICVICYTVWAITTNENLIRYTHDYLKSRDKDWRDAI